MNKFSPPQSGAHEAADLGALGRDSRREKEREIAGEDELR